VSGHSKWATTKHKKAIIDSRRAKSFAKLIKNIEVAAKMGGADMSGNPTLVDAVQKAKKTSVPNDNIDRAIKRGAGLSGESVDYQTIMYEGYGPSGVALLIECLTDNKNRAAAEVRTLMSRNGGTLADPGSVAYNFSRKGVISITKTDSVSEDDILLAVMDAGAEDVADQGGGFEVITDPSQLVAARTALVDAGIDYDSAEAEFVPNLRVEADAATARKVFRLIDALEDSDDVQNIFTNIEVPADVQAELDNDEE
jgi:YebC/PmpR family DNA-binding regulatory protein